MSTRSDAINSIAQRLTSENLEHPLRLAVDGITAGGKTTFAKELTKAISAIGRKVIHLSTNDYHNVAKHRHQNPDKSTGYYKDAYNFEEFARLVLVPLGPEGDGRYVARYHDLHNDTLLPERMEKLSPDSIVIVDGSFLQSAPLAGLWDRIVWVETSFPVAEERASTRDIGLFGSKEAVRTVYKQRYHAACRMYIDEHAPCRSADIVFHNDDLIHPRVKWQRP